VVAAVAAVAVAADLAVVAAVAAVAVAADLAAVAAVVRLLLVVVELRDICLILYYIFFLKCYVFSKSLTLYSNYTEQITNFKRVRYKGE
jgi:hypothetical protein